MESWTLYFLGFIALGSLVQSLFLIGMALSGLRLARRVQALQVEVEGRVQPIVDNLSRVAANVGEVTELADRQARRLEDVVAGTLVRVEAAKDSLGQVVRRPLSSLGGLAAVFKGVRRGVRVYRQLGGLEPQGQGASRRYRDDEHLFI